MIINGDRNGARDTSQISADHQHDAEFSQGVREAQHDGRDHARHRQRENHAPKGSQTTRAKHCRSIQQFSIDAFERGDERLHCKWEAVDDRREHQSAEGKRQSVAEHRLPQSAKRSPWAHRQQRVKSKNGGR